MDTNMLLQAALWVAGIIVIYGLLSRGLFRSAERTRARALDLAVELMASPEVPDVDKMAIRYTLDEFHSWTSAWRLAFSIILATVTLPFRRKVYRDPSESMSKETALKFNTYRSFWLLATLTNSLAATALFGFVGLLAMAFSISTDALKSALASGSDHRHGPHSNGHARA